MVSACSESNPASDCHSWNLPTWLQKASRAAIAHLKHWVIYHHAEELAPVHVPWPPLKQGLSRMSELKAQIPSGIRGANPPGLASISW